MKTTTKLRGDGYDHLRQYRDEISATIDASRAMRAKRPDLAFYADKADEKRATLTAADGWKTPSEFLRAVGDAATGKDDRRLIRAPLGANEGDPTSGGFAVPDIWAQDWVPSVFAGSSIAPLCSTVQLDGPIANIKLAGVDESSRLDGSRFGGARAYMLAESDVIASSIPKTRLIEFTTKKMGVYLPVTNELLADTSAAALNAFIRDVMAEEGGFLLSKQILTGSGVGQALGITNAPCTISVPKESGQSPATITQANVASMWSRLPLTSRQNACWIACEDAEAQIEQFAAPLYMPAGSANGNEFPLLKGRPLLLAEQASQLGTLGDLILADFSQYRIYQAPPRYALSVHKGFDLDQSAFRFILRFDGKPLYSSAVTSWNGSNITRSPFVTLAAR